MAREVASIFADPAPSTVGRAVATSASRREPGAPEDAARAMRRANPAFIPRNHRVEEIIEAAVQRNDFAPFETLVQVLERPYEDQPEFASWREPPRREERVRATFCGT